MKVIEAVGLAHRPGKNTIKRDIQRAFMRLFVWLLHLRIVPLDLRQRAMFGVLGVARWITSTPRLSPFGGASKGNTFENDLMKLIFQATAIANIADNAASSALTNLQVALHTADPGETGSQTTSEAAYTDYARVAVARTSGGWTVTNNAATPVAAIEFPASGAAGSTITHFSVGTAASGAGKILYYGTVTPNIAIGAAGITPRLTTATSITED